jgi:hypothetical protein
MSEDILNKTVEQETEEIIRFFEGDKLNIQRTLENQFSVLYQRSQVLLSLCGIIISVTGFSGKTIVLTFFTSRILLISGLFLVLLSGIITIWGVLRFKWITQWHEENLNNFVKTVLIRRNKKAWYFKYALILLLLGLALYVSSITFMLLFIQ